MQKKCILFDFDGVIVDSFDAAFSITQISRPWISPEEYRNFFMGNVYESLETQEKIETRPIIPISDEDYFKRYSELSNTMKPIDGMADVIARLAETHKISIVSSAYTYIIEDILERAGVRHHFTDILGADVEKNKSKKIISCMEKYGALPHEALFVTDTVGDIAEARHVGVDAIAVSWGYHELYRLVAAAPLAIVNTPQELLDTIL